MTNVFSAEAVEGYGAEALLDAIRMTLNVQSAAVGRE